MARTTIFWLMACLVVGCHKENPTPPSATPNAAENNIPGSTAEPTAAAPAANATPASAPATPPEYVPRPAAPLVVTTSDPSAATAELTQALRKYSMENRRVPKTVEELISAGYVKALPTPPPGKKFVVDPKRVEVKLQ